MTGLSRRRSRVRVPSLPFEKPVQIGRFFSYWASVMATKRRPGSFQEFTEEQERLDRIERIELPVARRREREEDANVIREERDQRIDAHANLLAGVERLQAE